MLESKNIRLATRAKIFDYANAGHASSVWYANAKRDIDTICEREAWPVERFASVLALLSPRVSVKRNARFAFQYCDNGQFFPNCVASVRQSVANWETSGVIGGQKVSAFQRAILGDTQACVLDVWMARAFAVDQYYFRRKNIRERCQNALASVAKRIGQSVRDTQACVWSGVILASGRNVPEFGLLAEYRNFLAHSRAYNQTGTIATLAE